MGWHSDDLPAGHEGYAVAVLADGTEPPPVRTPRTGADGQAYTGENSSWWQYDGQEGRPRAFAVKAGCACGWRSAAMFPVFLEDQDNTEGFETGDGPFAEWETEHVGQLISGRIPDDVADTIEKLRVQLAALADARPLAAVEAAARVEKLGTARLQQAVTSAVRGGASWTVIGTATGTTRQAAHQRFSKVPF
ncbi:hypothetical protein B6R96_36320 (plasmid) [Streptomyces sp. Sge12]|uniref:hypothetical protein n=1 Tax=Streptomyces sp. Sge12 TaxID=1972846 RepID=UPI0009C36EB9|nr:hypothetical protein [Streptomyces sp. Sge12]ARE79485.1 hypothetical protein B6R96_36320 [Streptomyces sp. Sge12]